ncbi:cupin domain-containing protein [Mucilaginibacter sp. HMF5004]|uniref:cupin domain-containing protein n=1 Tax=Mucilaginibacter rivuli TaxID=2857527 RepID=UPI001C606849|nr:cupin domain-containing protein [Mucilaginibacter rivuli]MBW4889307.1 cupin domain-containing protein [Mucilaginibacter rivuli]
MPAVKEIIRIGQLELRFLLDGDDTRNRLVMFEMIIPAGAKVPVPHYHIDVDEAVYGLEGTLSSIVNGEHISIGPGDHCFIPRGVVHYHDNLSDKEAKTLCVLTPASIGPAYFREIRDAIKPGVPPDPKVLGEIMNRHGLIPAVSKPAQ